MLCNKFMCVYLENRECEPVGGECIGDMCENWGECINCQQLDQEECEGLKGL